MPKGIPNRPAASAPVGHEVQGTAPDAGAAGYELQGRAAAAPSEPQNTAFELYETVPAPKLVAMELLRNYRPAGVFEIVGHVVPAVTRKDASGREYEVSKAQFIEGVGAPPPQAGVGTTGKIWAGTIIRVPQDEARTMRANDIAERSVDD